MPTLIPIQIDVEPAALGPVLLLLKDVPGVHGITRNIDGVSKAPKRKYLQNGNGGPVHDAIERPNVKVNAIIISELMTGQKNLQHLKEKVAAAGGSERSVSSALYTLSQKGVTHGISPSVHAMTDAAMERIKAEQAKDASPQLAPPQIKAKRGGSRPYVLSSIEKGNGRRQMVKDGAVLGCTERMIDGALTRLKVAKEIHMVEPGKFALGPPPRSSKKK